MSMKQEIGREIKQLRKKTKLTQIEFAKRVGVGLRFVRDLEQGKASVRMDKVSQVLDFLGYHLQVVSNRELKSSSKGPGLL